MALLYKTSAFLTNFNVCLYDNGQINAYFDFQPPNLEEYLEDEDRGDSINNEGFARLLCTPGPRKVGLR